MNARKNVTRKYKIPADVKQHMFTMQEGRCAICKKELTLWGKTGAHLDHCHKTGKLRQLLCSACNTGLGQFKDSPILLQTAITYLKKWGDT